MFALVWSDGVIDVSWVIIELRVSKICITTATSGVSGVSAMCLLNSATSALCGSSATSGVSAPSGAVDAENEKLLDKARYL